MGCAPTIASVPQTRIRGMNSSLKPKHVSATIPDPSQMPTLTVDAVARILHVSRASAYQAVHQGELPSLRMGRRILVPTAKLRRLLGLDGDHDRASWSNGGTSA